MKKLLVISAALIALSSCSSTRVLTEGQTRLAENRVIVYGDKDDPATSKNTISRYLYQPVGFTMFGGWNPLINLYNTTGGNGTRWDRFVERAGTAPTVFDEAKVAKSEENISNHLLYNGYYNNRVTSEVSTEDRKTTVTYKVETGGRKVIDKIDFCLPSEGTFAEDFIALRSEFPIEKGSLLSEASLEAAAEEVSQALRNKGYYGFSKHYFTFEADTLSRRDSADLKVTVGSYMRSESARDSVTHAVYRFADVSVSWPEDLNVRRSFMEDINLITPGEPYNETVVGSTYNRYTSLGLFSRVSVNLYPDPSTRTVDTKIELSPSKLQGFKVNLEGSTNSTGLLGISPQLSYFHKNIFHGGERLSIGFIGNYQFKFNDPSISSTENGVNASIEFPRFVFVPMERFKGDIPHTTLSASYNHQSRPEYTRNIISTSYSYRGKMGRQKKLSYVLTPLQMNIVNLYEIDSTFLASISSNPFLANAYQNHFDIGSGLDLYYSTSGTSPFYARGTFDIAGNALSLLNPVLPEDASGSRTIWNTPYSQYVRMDAIVGKTWYFGMDDRWSVATRAWAGAGFAYGNSSALPFEKHFWAGGASSLRGFQSRTIGPGRGKRTTTFRIPNQTGDMKLEANVELRFPLLWKLEGATFVDAGNVWTINSKGEDAALTDFNFSTLARSIAVCSGLGLRLNMSFIILRLDLGWPVVNPSGDPDHSPVLQFGIGYPF